MFSGLRGIGGSIPAEGSRAVGGGGLAADEECDGFGAEYGFATVQHALCELGQVAGAGEQACVRGYSAEDVGVFVLDLALDDFVAPGASG